MAAATHLCSFQRRPSFNEEIEDTDRYLCISDDFVIICLDLKKDTYSPLSSPLKLVEEGLPTSMGLFKLWGGAYMTGGQEYKDLLLLEEKSDGVLPSELYDKYDCKGSSCKTFHLLVASGKLSLFECDNIPPLKKPKHWPIVEKIGDRVHVIETVPHPVLHPETVPSHEVLNLTDPVPSWTQLQPMHHPRNEQLGLFICDHLVVGDKIYARARSNAREYLVFDSKTDEWKVNARGCSGGDDGDSTIHVLDLLCESKLICVGEYQCPKRESAGLYMVIELTTKVYEEGRESETERIEAAAHLVNPSTGYVVLSQDLPQLFGWLEGYSYMLGASLFRVNTEQGNTYCAVTLIESESCQVDGYLYITTFTVEGIEDDHVKQAANEFDFVKVVLKYQRVYLVDNDLGLGRTGWSECCPARLTACFLPHSL